MKTLLIIPPGGYYAERWSGGVLMPPLGVGYIASTLEQNNHEVMILDAHVKKFSLKAIQTYLLDIRPDIVGLTFTTENRFEAFKTARAIKEALPSCHLTAGGPHVSLAAEDTLEGISEFDSVVIGEGESTFLELVRALESGSCTKDLSKVPGIAFRESKNQIIRNALREKIMNVDSIPFPARHLYPSMKEYNFQFDVPGKGMLRFTNLMTSRGCPCACNFCATPKVWGRTVRMRSPENVILEIDQAVLQHGSQAIWFFDDTFNTSAKRVERICELIKEREYKLPWFCEVRVDLMTRDLLVKMKESGCYTLGFGVESGSQRILDDIIGKNLRLEQVYRLYEWCKEVDIIANPFFIISHPTETWDEANQTLRMIEHFREKAHASMAFLHVYPGTALEETARRSNLLPPDFRWTQEHRTDVKTLLSAQGNVPIFLDQLSWSQITDILFAWAEAQNYSVWKKFPKVLKSLRSFDDLMRYSLMGFRYLLRKLGIITKAPN